MKKYFAIALNLFLLAAACSAAELKLSPLFGSDMVLQRSTAVPVWGNADPAEKISITFAGQSLQTTADKNGNWKAVLAPLPASSKPATLTVTSSPTRSVSCDNVLVGDVWLCSGQSNMYMPIKNADNPAREIAAADHPQIRLLKMSLRRRAKTKETFQLNPWQKCTTDSAGDFSAAAYYFGCKINRDLNIPVGLIQSSVGGTQVERWIPKKDTDPSLEYLSSIGDLYDNMIHPFTNFAVRGFIWYQGESNGRCPEPYYVLFPQLIKSWRKVWTQNNPQLTRLPFFYVQIAPYRDNVDGLTPEAWAYIRDAQLKTLALADTGMVVTTDLGEYEDIHPKAKQPVGERLALHALKFAGKKCIASGPLYSSSKIKDEKIIINFTDTGSGLTTGRVVMNKKRNFPVAKDPDAYIVSKDKLTGFTIAGTDRNFITADAQIVGDTVVVSSPAVKSPTAVRYGWSTFPLCNLYNKEGLPTSPFRTDDYPVKDVRGRTVGKAWDGNTTQLGHALQFTGSTSETAWQQNSHSGRKGCQPEPGQGSKPSYAYFKVTNQNLKSGKCPKVVISIIYFDRGRGTVAIQYDSSDKKISVVKNNPGAWKNGGKLKLENTLTWKIAEFTITDAHFDGRCNGADIRLNCAKSFVFSALYCRQKQIKTDSISDRSTQQGISATPFCIPARYG